MGRRENQAFRVAVHGVFTFVMPAATQGSGQTINILNRELGLVNRRSLETVPESLGVPDG